jgi:hypothetical protein
VHHLVFFSIFRFTNYIVLHHITLHMKVPTPTNLLRIKIHASYIATQQHHHGFGKSRKKERKRRKRHYVTPFHSFFCFLYWQTYSTSYPRSKRTTLDMRCERPACLPTTFPQGRIYRVDAVVSLPSLDRRAFFVLGGARVSETSDGPPGFFIVTSCGPLHMQHLPPQQEREKVHPGKRVVEGVEEWWEHRTKKRKETTHHWKKRQTPNSTAVDRSRLEGRAEQHHITGITHTSAGTLHKIPKTGNPTSRQSSTITIYFLPTPTAYNLRVKIGWNSRV